MDYGLMAGLGEGLQQLGGAVFKAKFLDKLKEEETIRAEKRKEAQEAAKIDKKEYINRDGVWFEQDINPSGQVINERLAPKNKIEEFNRNEQKEKIGLENLITSSTLNKKKLDTYDEDRALDIEATRAKIEQDKAGAEENRAQADYYRMGGSGGAKAAAEAEAAGPEDYVQELLKQSKGLETQYTVGKTPKMTKAEYIQLARAAVLEGAKQGVDPRSTFAEILRRYLADPRVTKHTRSARGLEDELTDDDTLD